LFLLLTTQFTSKHSALPWGHLFLPLLLMLSCRILRCIAWTKLIAN